MSSVKSEGQIYHLMSCACVKVAKSSRMFITEEKTLSCNSPREGSPSGTSKMMILQWSQTSWHNDLSKVVYHLQQPSS